MRFFTGTDNPDFVGNPEAKCSSDDCKLGESHALLRRLDDLLHVRPTVLENEC
jgi:hypothetical protein